jgi:uncharacterized protein (TIGR02145 family)
MRAGYLFFVAFLVALLPANAQLFGGQIKTKKTLASQYPAGSVFCNGPTAIVDVTNPITGATWMDRNLGASRAATSSTDAQAYGDLYQWGRGSDGHQCRNSLTTTTLSGFDQPGNNTFILNSTAPVDWRQPQNTNLWQGVNGINNPCPSGYRLPTESEWNAEDASFSSQDANGAFNSPLKLSLAGRRNGSLASLDNVGVQGYYQTSTVASTSSSHLKITTITSNTTTYFREYGHSVRCIKN